MQARSESLSNASNSKREASEEHMGNNVARKNKEGEQMERRMLRMTFESAAIGDVGFKRARVLRYLVEMRYEYLVNHVVGKRDETSQTWKTVLTKALEVICAWMTGRRGEDREVIVYRGAINMLIIGGVRYRESRNLGRSRIVCGREANEHIARRNGFMKEVLEGVVPDNTDIEGLERFLFAVGHAFPMLRQIYSYACQILPYKGKKESWFDTRLYELYMSLCEIDGVTDKLVGEKRRVRYLNPYWDWQDYYGRCMFSIVPESRSIVLGQEQIFEATVFMQMLRLYVDSRIMRQGAEIGTLIRCSKRGIKRARDLARKTTDTLKSGSWGSIECSAFGIETVVNAWTIFAQMVGFRNVSDFCADLLVYDEVDIAFRIVPETRCKAAAGGNRQLGLLCRKKNAGKKRADRGMGLLGVSVWSEEASEIVRMLRSHEEEFRFWRKCVCDFVQDLNMISDSANFTVRTKDTAKSIPELEPFELGVGNAIPERFDYAAEKIQKLQDVLKRNAKGQERDKAARSTHSVDGKGRDHYRKMMKEDVVCIQRFPQSSLFMIAALTSDGEFVSGARSKHTVLEYSDSMKKALSLVELGCVLGAALAQIGMIMRGEKEDAEFEEDSTTLVTLRDIRKGALVGYSYGMFVRKQAMCTMDKRNIGENWFKSTWRNRLRCGLSVVPHGDAFNICDETFTNLIHIPGRHCPFRYAKYESGLAGNVRGEIFRIRPTTSVDNLKSHCFLAMRALGSINAGQEIIVCRDVKIKSR